MVNVALRYYIQSISCLSYLAMAFSGVSLVLEGAVVGAEEGVEPKVEQELEQRVAQVEEEQRVAQVEEVERRVGQRVEEQAHCHSLLVRSCPVH